MGYFAKKGKVKIDGNIVCNIYDRSIDIKSDMLYDYIIENAETPEQLAKRLYGKSEYYWVLLELNDCIHPINDWVMSDEELMIYANKIYGNNINEHHHYEDEDGNILYGGSPDESSGISITNMDYMIQRNEEKNHIKIISKSLLETIK